LRGFASPPFFRIFLSVRDVIPFGPTYFFFTEFLFSALFEPRLAIHSPFEFLLPPSDRGPRFLCFFQSTAPVPFFCNSSSYSPPSERFQFRWFSRRLPPTFFSRPFSLFSTMLPKLHVLEQWRLWTPPPADGGRDPLPVHIFSVSPSFSMIRDVRFFSSPRLPPCPATFLSGWLPPSFLLSLVGDVWAFFQPLPQ